MSELKVIRVKRSEVTAEELREISRNLKKGEMLDVDYTLTEEEYEKFKENGSEEEPESWVYTASTSN